MSARTASAVWFLAAFVVYSANGREIGAVDTYANTLLPIAVLRGDGLVLDRFAAEVRGQYYVEEKDGALLSRYPVLPALLAVPVTAPQLWAVDRAAPGWTEDAPLAAWWIRTFAKNACALFAALTVVLFHRLLLRLELGAVASAATLATAFGSNLWMVASQSPWQHGAAALFLTLGLLLLAPRAVPGRQLASELPPWRLAGAGLALAASVAARPTGVLFAAPLALWALYAHGRRSLWLLAPAAACAVALLAHNVAVFGDWLGGLGRIEALGHAQHGLDGWLVESPLVGLAGTLVSPSRGLFVFSPWALLAVLLLPWTRARLAPFPMLRVALAALVPFGLGISAYGVWWGGWSFGPRYWTEAMPLFGVLLACALAWARENAPRLRFAFGAAIAFSIALQTIGAFYYPSSWNSVPVSVDRAHERLWDWRDTEITRCLEEGPVWPPASYVLLWESLRG